MVRREEEKRKQKQEKRARVPVEFYEPGENIISRFIAVWIESYLEEKQCSFFQP